MYKLDLRQGADLRPNEHDRKQVGARIRTLRERKGLTQRELADRAGLTEAAMRSYELGYRMPSESQIGLMSKALGVSPEVFVGCSIKTDQEVIHLLFNLEGPCGFLPLRDLAAVSATSKNPIIETAFHDWGEQRAKLDAGEITEEEYKDWKDTYALQEKVGL